MFRNRLSTTMLVLLIAVASGLAACATPVGYGPAGYGYVDPYPDWWLGGWGYWGHGWGHWDHAWDHEHHDLSAHGYPHGHPGFTGHGGFAHSGGFAGHGGGFAGHGGFAGGHGGGGGHGR